MDIDLNALEQMDRQGLLDYIEALEAKTALLEEKMEDLKAQVDVLNMDIDDFKVPENAVPELRVSEETKDALAEAASIFEDIEDTEDMEDIEVDPAPVENGVVRLSPVTEEEAYIPVASAPAEPAPSKKTVKVRIKKKKA